MQDKQTSRRPRIRKVVAVHLPHRNEPPDAPTPEPAVGGLPVRTGIKGGNLLLGAGLLGNGAAAGGGSIPS